MTHDELQAFTDALNTLAETFRVPVTEGLLHGYWLALEDVPLAKIQKGCVLAARYEDRFPAPVTVRSYTRDQRLVL